MPNMTVVYFYINKYSNLFYKLILIGCISKNICRPAGQSMGLGQVGCGFVVRFCHSLSVGQAWERRRIVFCKNCKDLM